MSILELIMVIASIASTSGVTLWRVAQLEKKQDKHNGIVSKVYSNDACISELKSSVASAHHRLDENREDIREIKKDVKTLIGGKK